jgi:hypothetical protein
VKFFEEKKDIDMDYADINMLKYNFDYCQYIYICIIIIFLNKYYIYRNIYSVSIDTLIDRYLFYFYIVG